MVRPHGAARAAPADAARITVAGEDNDTIRRCANTSPRAPFATLAPPLHRRFNAMPHATIAAPTSTRPDVVVDVTETIASRVIEARRRGLPTTSHQAPRHCVSHTHRARTHPHEATHHRAHQRHHHCRARSAPGQHTLNPSRELATSLGLPRARCAMYRCRVRTAPARGVGRRTCRVAYPHCMYYANLGSRTRLVRLLSNYAHICVGIELKGLG